MEGRRTVGNVSHSAPVRGLGEKVRIFVGTEPKAEIARKVLECSINRRTDAAVEIVPMIGPKWEYPTAGIKVGTGFSLRRWMIPEYCGWHGRAIYMDADQLVFSDVWDLWTKPDQHPQAGASVWCTYQHDKYNEKFTAPQSSVMVIDCAAAKDEGGWHIDRVLALLQGADRDTYARFMHCEAPTSRPAKREWWTKVAPVKIGVEWNSLNVFAEGKTKLLHYTKEPEQPWYKPDHPHAMRWKMEFQIALNLGYITADEIRDAIKKYNVKEDWRGTNGLHPDYIEYIKNPKYRKK
jgi:hypothetical protein